ncbi:hypothetical protein GCM10027614_12300 [Micromonospora vulcania]
MPTQPAAQDDKAVLAEIDHLAVCVPPGQLDETVRHYQRLFDFGQIFEEHVEVGGQGMNSKVVQSPSGQVTVVLLEPDRTRRPGQIDAFLDQHAGAGVQHLGCGPTTSSARWRSWADGACASPAPPAATTTPSKRGSAGWTRRWTGCVSWGCWSTPTTAASCCRSSPSRCTYAARSSWS